MIEILKKSLKEKPNKNISLIFTTWEETWIYNWLTEIIKSQKLWWLDFVIALEPTWWKINVWVFWYIDWEFVFKWRSCHSSNPSKWENAIHKTSALLEYLKNPTILKSVNYFWEKLQEVLIASNISWWVARNVVPDSCSVTINHRYLPGKKIEDVEDSFLTLATEIWADSFKILCHDPSSKIVEVSNPMLLDFIKKIRWNVSMLSVVPFWSDIGQTSYKWIPSINFWPWNIAQAHTADEFLLKKDFEKTFNQFINYLFN
jgi:succinyl-diaminopimelate desuccinylase